MFVWQYLFDSQPLKRQCSLGSESGTTKLLPQELYSASQPQASITLNCVREHLCFIWVYFVHPLARYILRYQKCLREHIRVFTQRKTGHNLIVFGRLFLEVRECLEVL